MTDSRFHVLLVAPAAPPKNSPEALQVRRLLQALDSAIDVTLVTTPAARGWQWTDESLRLEREGLRTIVVSLPLHRLSQRILANHRLARFHVPDSDFWIGRMAGEVTARISRPVDVIYSRSSPFSAAVLAKGLKEKLTVPWMMHLSDPWAGSPYRADRGSAFIRDREMEGTCISMADRISLTTKGQAAFYAERYPDRVGDLRVFPNMLPTNAAIVARKPEEPGVEGISIGADRSTLRRILHLGALYGGRNPSGFLEAIRLLRERRPELAQRLEVRFVGNATETYIEDIQRCAGCSWSPPVAYSATNVLLAAADYLLLIEPKASHPLHAHFMPSKMTDYMASGKPMIALTDARSVAAKYCRDGFGWRFDPDDAEGIAAFLVDQLSRNEVRPTLNPPSALSPGAVVGAIERELRAMAGRPPDGGMHEA